MSYITVPAEKVAQCCKNWILAKDIEACRRAANVLAKMAKEKKYLFFGPEIGYQGAFEYYSKAAGTFDSLKYYACFWQGEELETVIGLLLLAENGDPVILSHNHAFILEY